MAEETTLSVVLRGDARGLVGEVRVGEEALRRMGARTDEAGAAAGRARTAWQRLGRGQIGRAHV